MNMFKHNPTHFKKDKSAKFVVKTLVCQVPLLASHDMGRLFDLKCPSLNDSFFHPPSSPHLQPEKCHFGLFTLIFFSPDL